MTNVVCLQFSALMFNANLCYAFMLELFFCITDRHTRARAHAHTHRNKHEIRTNQKVNK